MAEDGVFPPVGVQNFQQRASCFDRIVFLAGPG